MQMTSEWNGLMSIQTALSASFLATPSMRPTDLDSCAAHHLSAPRLDRADQTLPRHWIVIVTLFLFPVPQLVHCFKTSIWPWP